MSTWEYHVEQQENGGWGVRRGDQERPGAFYANRNAAISAARVLSHQNDGVVVLHDSGVLTKTDFRGRPLSE